MWVNMNIWKVCMLKLECFFGLEKRWLSHTQKKKKKRPTDPDFFSYVTANKHILLIFYALDRLQNK